jgi:hypothetical protein
MAELQQVLDELLADDRRARIEQQFRDRQIEVLQGLQGVDGELIILLNDQRRARIDQQFRERQIQEIQQQLQRQPSRYEHLYEERQRQILQQLGNNNNNNNNNDEEQIAEPVRYTPIIFDKSNFRMSVRLECWNMTFRQSEPDVWDNNYNNEFSHGFDINQIQRITADDPTWPGREILYENGGNTPICDAPSMEQFYFECILSNFGINNKIRVILGQLQLGQQGLYWQFNQPSNLNLNVNNVNLCLKFANPATNTICYKEVKLMDIIDDDPQEGFNHFKKKIEDLLMDEEESYDPLKPNYRYLRGYVWDSSSFGYRIYKNINFGQAFDDNNQEYIIYKTYNNSNSNNNNNNNNNNDCVQKALSEFGYNEPAIGTSVDNLIDFVKDNGLPISIIYNTPKEVQLVPRNYVNIKLNSDNNSKNFYKMHQDTPLNYCHKAEPTIHYIVYDVERSHVEACLGKPELRDDVYSDYYAIVRLVNNNNNNIIIVREYPKEEKKEKPDRESQNVFFVPFEIKYVTCYMNNNYMKPIGLSYSIMNKDTLMQLSDGEKNINDEYLKFLSEKCKVTCLWKYNCVKSFLQTLYDLCKENDNNHYVLISHKSCEVDNFILLNELQAMKFGTEKTNISYVGYHGMNRIGELHFFKDKCIVMDLNRHLMSTEIQRLGSDFGIVNLLMLPDIWSYYTLQSYYYKYGYDESLFYDKIKEYVNEGYQSQMIRLFQTREPNYEQEEVCNDFINYNCSLTVFTYAILFIRYYCFMKEMPCFQEANTMRPSLGEIYDNCSLPSYLYRVFKTFAQAKYKLALGTANYNQYEFIMSSSIAGRADCFDNAGLKYEGEVVHLDARSLYPFLMFCSEDAWYPHGHPYDGIQTEAIIADLVHQWQSVQVFNVLGFYTINIDQTILVDKGLPLIISYRNEEEEHEWFYSERSIIQKERVTCTADIIMLLKYGCKIEYVLNARCIIFPKMVGNNNLFGWMETLMLEKQKQDHIKKVFGKDSNEYSPVKRTITKLMMNCTAGYLLKHPIEEVFEQVNKEKYYSNIIHKKDMVPGSQAVVGLVNEHNLVMSYKKNKESITGIKEVWIGVYIYAYARAYMYDNVYSKLDSKSRLYTDTDSIIIPKKIFDDPNSEIRKSLTKIIPSYYNYYNGRQKQKMYTEDEEEDILFGGFVNESKKNNLFFCNGKKQYGIFYDAEDGLECEKFSLVGISREGILVDQSINFVSQSHSGYYIVDQEKAFNYYHNNTQKKLDKVDNCIKLFNMLYEGLDVFILQRHVIHVLVDDNQTTGLKHLYHVKKVISANKSKLLEYIDAEDMEIVQEIEENDIWDDLIIPD